MTTGTLTRLPIAELIEDLSVYPRHSVDGSHVNDIARAVQAGITLKGGPIIADKASKRIVDGFHRRRAYRKVYGDTAEVDVELRDYANDAALLEDAVALNSGHGRKLDKQDETRCALLLQKQGISVQRIAVVLSTTTEHVQQKLLVRVIQVEDNGHRETVPAKPVARAPKGEPPRVISREQHEVHASASGHRTGQTVTQLTRELRSGLVDVNNSPGLREKLEDLRAAIDEVL